MTATATAQELADLVADVREVIADIDRAADDEQTSRQHIIECVRARLVDLVGEPTPPAPPALILARPGFTTPGLPFDRIVITHPNNTTETLDVPGRIHGCAHSAPGAGCRLGPHRWHATLRAAGYREIGRPDNAPEGVTAVERVDAEPADPYCVQVADMPEVYRVRHTDGREALLQRSNNGAWSVLLRPGDPIPPTATLPAHLDLPAAVRAAADLIATHTEQQKG